MLNTLLTLPEGKTLEFKRDLSSPRPWLKTLVAFANTAGGKLVIGVEDDRRVTGVEDPLAEEERLCSFIADSIAPRLVPNIELVTIDGKTLLIAEVFPSSSRPHFLRAEGPENGVFVRLGSTNRQADRELIVELRRSVEGGSFDELPLASLTAEDLDLKVAADFSRVAAISTKRDCSPSSFSARNKAGSSQPKEPSCFSGKIGSLISPTLGFSVVALPA